MSLYLELQPPERVVYVHGEGLAPDRVHALGDVAGLTRTKIGFFLKKTFLWESCVFSYLEKPLLPVNAAEVGVAGACGFVWGK